MKQENEKQQQLLNTLEGEKNDLTASTKQAEDSRVLAETEAEGMRSKLGEFSAAAAKDKAVLQADVEDKAAAIDALEHELDDLKALNAQNSDDYIQNITESRSELSEIIADEKARAASAEAEVTKATTLGAEIQKRLDMQLAAKEAQHKQALEMVSEQKANIGELTDQLEQSKAETHRRDDKIEDLKVVIEGLKAENLNVQTQIQKATDELAAEKAQLQGQINVLGNEVETQTKNVERRTAELATANAAVEAVRANLNMKTQEYSELSIANEKEIAEKNALKTELETVTDEFKKQIQSVTESFQEQRTKMEELQATKVESLNATIAANEANNQKQLADMTAQRKRIEDRNIALQTELKSLQTKYKKVSATLVDTNTDLSKAQQTIAKNAEQFKQFATDLENVGTINDKLRADLEQQKADWDEDMAKAAKVQEGLHEKLVAAEEMVADMQRQVLAVREEIIEAEHQAEHERAEAKTANDKVHEQEQTISQMEDAAAAAEDLRNEFNEHYKEDLENGQAEREHLEEQLQEMTENAAQLQMKLDENRQFLLEARQIYTEENIKRVARESDVANGKMREEQLGETINDKVDALEKAAEAAKEAAETAADEVNSQQQKVVQLEEELNEKREELNDASIEISTWKAKEQESSTRADEGWAKAEAETDRADDAEEQRKNTEDELTQTQADWKADLEEREDEKIALAEKDEELMQDLEDTRTKQEEESNLRMEAENAREGADNAQKEAETQLDELSASRTELEEKFQETAGELSSLTAEHDAFMQQMTDEKDAYEQEHTNLRDEVEDTKTQLEDSVSAQTAAEQAQGDAEQERDSMQADKEEAERDRDDAIARLEEAQEEMAQKIEEMHNADNSSDEMKMKLEGDIEALTTEKGDLEDGLARMTALQEDTADKASRMEEERDDTSATAQELENWKTDALAEQEAEKQHLADTIAQMTNDIKQAKTDEANAQAQKEVTEKKYNEAVSKQQVAQAAATNAVEEKKAAKEHEAIAKADAEVKTATIQQTSDQLRAAGEAKEQALAARAEFQAELAARTDEVGHLRQQCQAALRNEESANWEKQDADRKIASFETMAHNNNKLLAELRNTYKAISVSRNKQKDHIGKLLDMVSTAEAQAKSARDARGGDPPVNAGIRQMAQELSAAVSDAASAFDSKLGAFEPSDVAGAARKDPGGGYDDTMSAELSGAIGGNNFSTSAAGAGTKPKSQVADFEPVASSRPSSSATKSGGSPSKPKKSSGGGGDYSSLNGTLEKLDAKGKGKKRHFQLGRNTLTYSQSNKPNAKVLGIIQLAGGSAKQKKESIVVKDGNGKSSGEFSIIHSVPCCLASLH